MINFIILLLLLEICLFLPQKAGLRLKIKDKTLWNRLFFFITFITFFLLFYLTRQQFVLWRGNNVSKFLLPPYSSIGYFAFYAFIRIWAPYLISLVIGLTIFWLAVYFNREKGKYFQPEELYFLLITTFLVGHPGWILYWILILAVALLISIFQYFKMLLNLFLKGKEKENLGKVVRISFYYLWIAVGIVAMLLNQFLLSNWKVYSRLLL